MTTVSGSVDRIVFRNPETGYCVARFRLSDPSVRDTTTTVVGAMPDVRVGEVLRLTGEWQLHPVHGRNFRVERFEAELPDTAEGIERYLGSGVVAGVGPVTAARIVEHFGDESLRILDEESERLLDVAGISRKRLEVIQASWQEQKEVRDLALFLQDHGMSVGLAARIYGEYGREAVDVIKRDPYQLAHDVHCIGFRTADAVAAHLGIPKDSPSRYVAGLRYVLSEAAEDGHLYLSRPATLARGAKLLRARVEALEPALLDLIRRGDAVIDRDDVYLTPFYKSEAGAARLVAALQETPSVLTLDRRSDPSDALRRAAEVQGLALAPGQLEAAHRALTCKISVLTGGPGTGKTSTLRTLIVALELMDVTYALCAPTGRAAKRVAETTERPASTIHRLLEYQPGIGIFGRDHINPLEADVVIVDEVSMLDAVLFYHLLKAVPPESHLLLVGDADQLPAVGPGSVLRELIASDRVPTTRLTDLFRQARGSNIIRAAHAINRGEVPEIGNAPADDLFFTRADNDEAAVSAIKRLLLERIPHRFGFDPVDDVQVISPMHRGPAGVANLNTEIQGLLNPASGNRQELARGQRLFRLGDKVMQIRNNYEKDVFNGDLGRVTAIRNDEGALDVTFGRDVITYEAADLDEIVLAYAISVHKAQGSEFPCIVMPLVTRHFMLLQRHLLYTAITRARQLCVLVGSRRALEVAVATDRGDERNTHLAERLNGMRPPADQIGLL